MLDWLQQLTPPTNVAGPTLIAYTLFDIFLIIILARLLGNLFSKLGQPRVVGEILAGILLGPTLLGDLTLVVTPLEVRPVLSVIATMALIFFMFIAGAEFNMELVQGRVGQAGLLAFFSVALPASLGFPLAYALNAPEYIGTGIDSTLPFALLLGAALSVTAFPVMAHILMERGQLNTAMGAIGVAAAAIITVLMFLYIAFAAAAAAGDGYTNFLFKLGLVILFLLAAWYLVRPALAAILPGMFEGGTLSGNGVALVFAGVLLFGLITHLLDINALVGGFIWGIILPQDLALRRHLADKVRDVTLVLFLPVFFALAGFATDLKLLQFQTIPAIILVLLAAVLGKFVAAAPARTFDLSWDQIGILGALFNTRGLLVLVVGLIGLELAIFTPLTYTILVIVALATNLMTLPVLNRFAHD